MLSDHTKERYFLELSGPSTSNSFPRSFRRTQVFYQWCNIRFIHMFAVAIINHILDDFVINWHNDRSREQTRRKNRLAIGVVLIIARRSLVFALSLWKARNTVHKACRFKFKFRLFLKGSSLRKQNVSLQSHYQSINPPAGLRCINTAKLKLYL